VTCWSSFIGNSRCMTPCRLQRLSPSKGDSGPFFEVLKEPTGWPTVPLRGGQPPKAAGGHTYNPSLIFN
jgi:hypothetical protein